jgi:2-dehydro-3-deoxyphosphogluconate aldolase/(4S)-4-hydroxy-2-oxoglutarate aldolase
VPLARALVDGGVRVLEVTLRTPVALACMEAIARRCPRPSSAPARCARGRCQARHGTRLRVRVSPGYTRGGAGVPRAGLPLLPGVATASEVMAAMRTATRS